MIAAQDPLIHTLFSCAASFNVAPPPPRRTTRPAGGDVPKNTEGLRMLAAEGSWIDLLDLAQNLERELVRANQLNTTNSAQMQKQNHIDGAVMQLILTRVTAYTKMNDYGRAVQVIQSIPFDKIPEQDVPFSLLFLKAFLPTLLATSSQNQIAASQNTLYAMLSKLESEIDVIVANQLQQQQSSSSQSQSTSTSTYKNEQDPIALLEHRRLRVARGLFIGHLRSQQHVTATMLLQTIARFHAERKHRLLLHLQNQQKTEFSENIFTTSSVVSKASAEYSSSQKRSLKSAEHLQRLVETSVMEELLCLQQALCLALFAGNAPLAHLLRKAVELVNVEECCFGNDKKKKMVKATIGGDENNKSSSSSDDTSSSSSSSSSDNEDDVDDVKKQQKRSADARKIANKKAEPQHLKELMMCLNDSLLDVFFDRPADASSRLCNVVGTFLLDPSNTVLPPSIRNIGKYGNISNKTVFEEKQSTGSSMLLPFYLEPARSIHVQHQFLSICLTVIGLVPHTVHAPPTAASQRAPASIESKRPQNSPETSQLCNAALDRLATAVPHLVLRMPAFQALVAEVRSVAMNETAAQTRKQVYQSVLSYLVAGRESIGSLC